MSTIETEDQLLDMALAHLRAEGYDIYRRPPPHMLPAFMAGYRPDAIAIGPDRKIAIDIIVEGANAGRKAEKQARFRDQRDWEHRILYAPRLSSGKDLREASKSAIEGSLATLDQLKDAGLTPAALLIGWATFEALGRRLCPARFKRPQTPARLVEVLASEGQLTPDEADNVRRLIDTRNRLIHGDLEVEVTKEDIERFTAVLQTLLAQAEEQVGED